MWTSEVPEFYEKISEDEEDYAILEIPNAFPGISYSDYMYYQTIHGKKLVNGYVSRTPDYAVMFLNSMPFISHLTKDPPPLEHEDILSQDLIDIGPVILNYYGIRYIVLHRDRMTAEQFDFASNLLQRSIERDPFIYENDSIIVYKVEEGPTKSFMRQGYGWHDIENWSGILTRWMSDDAYLLIYSDENRTADLNLQALSFYRTRTLNICINDGPWTYAEIPNEDFVLVKTPINLIKGTNIIRFHVPEGCESPCDIPELKNEDQRCLSVAIQDVIISSSPNSNELTK